MRPSGNGRGSAPNAAANASHVSGWVLKPPAAGCPPRLVSHAPQASSARTTSKSAVARTEPRTSDSTSAAAATGRPSSSARRPATRPEQAGRPGVVPEGDRSGRERGLGRQGAGGGDGRLGQLASPKVHRLELVQQPFRRCRIALHQQVQRQLGIGNAPGGVQARHDPEPDVAVGGMGGVGAGSPEQALQPGVAGRRQLVQPQPNDHPAFPGHGRHVGDRPEGGHRGEVRHRDPVPRDERRGEPICNPGPGEIRIGVDAVRAMGVDHGHRGREHRSGDVVIGDDDVHPQLGGEGDLGHVAHPAVAGDHQAGRHGPRSERRPSEDRPYPSASREGT